MRRRRRRRKNRTIGLRAKLRFTRKLLIKAGCTNI